MNSVQLHLSKACPYGQVALEVGSGEKRPGLPCAFSRRRRAQKLSPRVRRWLCPLGRDPLERGSSIRAEPWARPASARPTRPRVPPRRRRRWQRRAPPHHAARRGEESSSAAQAKSSAAPPATLPPPRSFLPTAPASPPSPPGISLFPCTGGRPPAGAHRRP